VNIRITRGHTSLFSLIPIKKTLIKYSVLRSFSRNIMLISLIFLSDDVLSVMSFFFLQNELYKRVISRPIFRAGARNCCVYEAHCITSSTSSRRSSTAIEKTLREVYSSRERRARLSSNGVSRFVLSPPRSHGFIAV